MGMAAMAENEVKNVTQNLNYSSLNDAITNAAENDVIIINEDLVISSQINVNKTITIKSEKNVTIKLSDDNTTFATLIVSAGAPTIGCDEYKITFDGNRKKWSNNFVEYSSTSGDGKFINLAFKDYTCSAGANARFILKKNNSTLLLKNISFDNCMAPHESGNGSIIRNENKADGIKFEGNISITNAGATKYDLYLKTRFNITANGAKFNKKMLVCLDGSFNSINQTFATIADPQKDKYIEMFDVANDNLGTCRRINDLKTTEAYTLDVSDAGAATLILPYDARIPAGASVYTISYSTGNSANATEVTNTLNTNTPVYIKAEEGKYKFTNKANVSEVTAPSGIHTSGALTGVYTTTDVPEGSYILYNGSKGVGFYKSNSSTVNAYRCYLTAKGAPANLRINFGEATGISDVQSTTAKVRGAECFNLNGQRVSNSSKGIVIINGKKFINK